MSASPSRRIHTEKVRTGQQFVIYAVLLNLLSFPLRLGLAGGEGFMVSLVIVLIALALGIVGIIRLSTGLGYHWLLAVLFCLLLVIPLVNLIVLLFLSTKATRQLRAAGYKVGFLGAQRRG